MTVTDCVCAQEPHNRRKTYEGKLILKLNTGPVFGFRYGRQ